MALSELILSALAVAVGVTIYRRYFLISRGLHRRSPRFSGARLGLGTVGVGLLSFATLTAFSVQPAVAATTVNLGSASTYAVVAGSTITNTGASVINGNVALSPGTSITGFPPGIINGTTATAGAATTVQTDATNAEVAAAGETSTSTVAAGTLGGGTPLTPGVYTSGSFLQLNGTLTLDGQNNPNSVFIFQAGSTLTTASTSSVELINGAQACNVFWQVGSSATLGSGSTLQGTILAVASVTLGTTASIQGRALAQLAVTLDGANTITAPTTCLTALPTTTTTVAPTTTTTVAPTTTTTAPTTTTTAHHVVTSTSVPVGAPATGFGGTAGGSSPLGLIGLGALAVAAGAATVAVRVRRSRGGSSGDHTSGL